MEADILRLKAVDRAAAAPDRGASQSDLGRHVEHQCQIRSQRPDRGALKRPDQGWIDIANPSLIHGGRNR